MEAIKNGLCKNLTPAQLWSGARFFLLLNLSLIICAAALNFYCAPNHFVFGGTTGLSVVLATCFPALSVSTFMWITNAVLDVLGCVFLGIKAMGWTLYSSFMLSFYSSMCEKLFPMSQPLTDDTLLELCFAVALPALASGIVFNIGASTGGTEIVAMILHKYIKVEIGRALLLSDIGTVLFAACIYGPLCHFTAPRHAAEVSYDNTLFLGGGVGFFSKTLTPVPITFFLNPQPSIPFLYRHVIFCFPVIESAMERITSPAAGSARN